MTWTQTYDPNGTLWVAAIIAAVPVILFILTLILLRMKGYLAGTIIVILALLAAVSGSGVANPLWFRLYMAFSLGSP